MWRTDKMADTEQTDSRRAGIGVATARLYPPRMTRSQPQLATAYAPGAMFTWEGGKGACIAVPVEGAAIDFSARPTRRDQIIESLEEFCQKFDSLLRIEFENCLKSLPTVQIQANCRIFGKALKREPSGDQ